MPTRRPSPAVLLVGTLLAMFSVLLVVVFASTTRPVRHGDATFSAASYEERVALLLVDANPAHGDALLRQYACASCHVAGAAHNLAPSFDGLAARAAAQHPPLSAAAYIYESIVYPADHVVSGYSGNMPLHYGNTISDRELGDLIAYLLTFDQAG